MKRTYIQRERAERSRATRQAIVDAAAAELWSKRPAEVRLERIAARAGVTVQTVLRIYRSRARLVRAAWEAARDRIVEQRQSARPGDVPGTVRALFDHYEELGDFVVRLLAEEQALPEMAEWLRRGRQVHRRSMERQFRRRGREVVDALVAACDVYVWKLLRRDMGRGRRSAEAVVRRLVEEMKAPRGAAS